MWGGRRALPRETLLLCPRIVARRGRKPKRTKPERAEAPREQRVADSRVVLMRRGLRNLVTEWRRKPRGPGRGSSRDGMVKENPPFMTVNTHPKTEQVEDVAPNPSRGDGGNVAVDDGKTWTRDEEQRHRRVAVVLWQRDLETRRGKWILESLATGRRGGDPAKVIRGPVQRLPAGPTTTR